jgi:shikimate kinase
MPYSRPLPARPIVLVGLPGAGKSTVGRLLARRLGLGFADSDEAVERMTALSVPAIFERFGEAHFRTVERQALERLAVGPAKVIATGGGAFLDAATRTLLIERCTVVWLDAPVEALAARIGGGKGRPLLGDGDPRTALAGLAERRNQFYAEAHFSIATVGRSPEEVAEALVEALFEQAR